MNEKDIHRAQEKLKELATQLTPKLVKVLGKESDIVGFTAMCNLICMYSVENGMPKKNLIEIIDEIHEQISKQKIKNEKS